MLDLDDANNRARAAFDMVMFDHAFLRTWYRNMAEVVPGVWRSNQPSPKQLKMLADDGFATIINLRGPSEWGSYHLEKRSCEALGITLVDLRLYSRGAPHREAIFALDAVFREAKKPILMHCKAGADRAGLGAALYVLLTAGGSVEDALAQLSPRFGHFKAAKTGVLDYFLQEYQAFNALTPTPFLQWVEQHYDREQTEARFTSKRAASFVVDRILARE